jgi:hypothetical protein
MSVKVYARSGLSLIEGHYSSTNFGFFVAPPFPVVLSPTGICTNRLLSHRKNPYEHFRWSRYRDELVNATV